MKVKKLCFSGTCIKEIKNLKAINKDLLKACKDAVESLGEWDELKRVRRVLEEAILKAEAI